MTELYSELKPAPRLCVAGSHLGHVWVITSNGSHPCAYVAIEVPHGVDAQTYIESIASKIECHGGVTYSGSSIEPVNFRLPPAEKYQSVWWIGWDYAHSGDSVLGDSVLGRQGKLWSKREITSEIKIVAEQIEGILGRMPAVSDRLADRFRGIVC